MKTPSEQNVRLFTAEIVERIEAAATAFKQMGYDRIDARVWMKTLWPIRSRT